MPQSNEEDAGPRYGYPFEEGCRRLGISTSHGYALKAAGIIRVVYLGASSPKITDQEIARLLTEGIPRPPGKAKRVRIAGSPQPETAG